MGANITQGRSTQYGVANGMEEDICIGMPQGTFVMFDLNSPKPEGDPFFQAVHIIAEANPEAHVFIFYLEVSKIKAQGKAEGIGQWTVLPVGGYQVGKVQGKYIEL